MPSPEFLQRPGSIWEEYPFEGKPFDQIRAEMEDIAVHTCHPPRDIRWEPGECGGVKGKWVYPADRRDGVVLYIHGGGFTLGSSGISLPFLVELAQELHIASFSVDYALAPERTFPAPQNDVLAAYQGLLDLGIPGDQIILAGESAGGTLCLTLALMIKEKHLFPPRAIVAMSPVADCTVPGGEKVLEDLPDMSQTMALYAPGQDPANPLLSPIFGDLENFPPTLLIAGGAEPLCSDSLRMAEALVKAGGEVELIVGRDMIHTYPLDFADYPEAAEAFSEIAAYIRIKLGLED